MMTNVIVVVGSSETSCADGDGADTNDVGGGENIEKSSDDDSGGGGDGCRGAHEENAEKKGEMPAEWIYGRYLY
jgi:hypothetical protein